MGQEGKNYKMSDTVIQVSKKKKFKLRNGGTVLIDVSEESCRRFANFVSGDRIERISRKLPKPEESLDLWKAAPVLYEATIIGVGNNPTATLSCFGKESLWIQIDGDEFVICYPPDVKETEGFADIGVVRI